MLPMVTTLLCASKRDFFLSKWATIVDFVQQRFRVGNLAFRYICLIIQDRNFRAVALDCLLRLVWIYVYRHTETMATTQKKMDSFIKTLFPAGRKPINPIEVPLDPFCRLVKIIAERYPDYAVKNILLYLLNVDSNIQTLDHIAPERAIIAITVYLDLLSQHSSLARFPIDGTNFPSGIPALPENAKSSSGFGSNHSTFHIEDYSEKFQTTIEKIVSILDQNFGNFLLTDDRFAGRTGGSAIVASGAADLGSFLTKEKQPYHDLLRTWLSGLPALLSQEYSQNGLLELVCKYTLHIDPDLSSAANDALERQTRQSAEYALAVVQQLRAFLLSIQDKYVEPFERTARLFVQLWEITLENLLQNETYLDHTLQMWTCMQDLEIVGLLLLCHHMPTIRARGSQLIRVADELHTALLKRRKEETTGPVPTSVSSPVNLYSVLKTSGSFLVEKYKAEYSGFAESYLDKQNETTFLRDLASSENAGDSHFWSKIFPDLIRLFYQHCPSTVHSCLEPIGDRLLALHPGVVTASDPSRSQNATLTTKWVLRNALPASDDMIDQWKFYLMFICASIANTEPIKKIKRTFATSSTKSVEKIATAQELFRLILPLLSSEKSSIRVAVVLALGRANWAVFKTVIEEMKPTIKTVVEDMRSRYMRGSQKRVKKLERLRAEITHIFSLSADFVQFNDYLHDEQLIGFLLSYIRELGAFLSDAEVQMEWDRKSTKLDVLLV
jgi:hypothetical protein